MGVEKINVMDVIPCVAEHVRLEMIDNHVVMSFPRYKSKWMQRLFSHRGQILYNQIEFEEHGSAVLALIDGKRTVRDIVERLGEGHFKDEPGYEMRVTVFVQQMQKDGLLSLVTQK